MNQTYIFEPPKLEIFLTECVGNSLLQGYYRDFIEYLGIKPGDKILDYCSGSGIISQKIAKKLKDGQLVYTDVSKRWLSHAGNKLKAYRSAYDSHLCDFTGTIMGGEYDKILVHYVLHEFPPQYQVMIIEQLVKNLKGTGLLFIREPISLEHGIKLHRLINLIESTKVLSYEYNTAKMLFMGEFVDVRCWQKQV